MASWLEILVAVVCIFIHYVSQITLWDILFFTVSLFFNNTYVLYTIRKGFWCRINKTFVCVSVRPYARVLAL